MTSKEINFIDKYVRKVVNSRWRKLTSQLCDVEDLVNEAILKVLLWQKKESWPKYGNNTIKRIVRNRIISYTNRDLRWFTHLGKRKNPNYYNTVIPAKQGFLRTVELGNGWKYDWPTRMRETDLYISMLSFVQKTSEDKSKDWTRKNKEMIREKFWVENS